jgi:hypothetical protein
MKNTAVTWVRIFTGPNASTQKHLGRSIGKAQPLPRELEAV